MRGYEINVNVLKNITNQVSVFNDINPQIPKKQTENLGVWLFVCLSILKI